ncbi:MAG: hypothetical protein AMXMBFR33_17770 [Candidatus Xenobia bacterium]
MDFLNLNKDERSAVFLRGSELTGRSPRLLEKDFWVCWVLERLFTAGGLPELTFKGGTSLSKAYGVIDRFSEDIDITVDRKALGFREEYPSQSKREKALEALDQELRRVAREEILPLFEGLEISQLRAELAGEIVIIYYPTVLDAPTGYLVDTVRVELGGRNPTEPSELRELLVDLAEYFPDIRFPHPRVRVLSAVRTFWEKATILHSYHSANEAIGHRKSRHYYDLVKLARHELGAQALADIGMLETVAQDKNLLFRSGKARYDLARPGTLRLVPSEAQLASLREDYSQMQVMFYEVPPTFDDLVTELRRLETLINVQ